MRDFDHAGLLLAEYQGKLVEKSFDLPCSSPIFLRRFFHSSLLSQLDDDPLVSLDVNEGMQSILDEFGDTSYGKIKYSKSSLFWIGYMYRYIAYTREETSRYVMKVFNYKQMNDVYYAYHTQDPEWCISSLLQLNGLPEDTFDKNRRLKRIMKAKGR